MAGVGGAFKSVLPARLASRTKDLRRRRALRREYAEDRKRYARWALPGEMAGGVSGRNLEAQLTKDYHRVEKALALSAPSQPFGAQLEVRLRSLIEEASAAGTPDAYVGHAQTALAALESWNAGGERSDVVSPVRRDEGRGIADPVQFFASRHSVRDFDPAPIGPDLLDRAVSLAINSPSVCNRQGWNVRFFNGEGAAAVLKFQNGNRGFTTSVPTVALVSVDARLFSSAGERNQAWIEGGLFSMSLVWALHALGLDSCMLNMSVGNDRAAELRDEYGIPDWELIIMMIAVGHGREGHRVARSPRRDLDSVRVKLGNS